MSDAVTFVVLTLATYRVWRLLFADDLPPVVAVRDRVVEATFRRHGSEWSDGFACPWCSGWWTSCATVAITWVFRPLPLPGLWFLAVACAVALIGSTIDDD